ncbi:hypothetical protein MYX04_02580 [Nitrospiraceae bacterium AH_259_D15_M11_P09]|nr:hypothetical protein [Nitrospiraceae bacterium AH_259_D15_M11_P09]
MRWAILVLVVVLAFGWVSLASAECAWLLWIGSTDDPGWRIEDVYEIHDLCKYYQEKAYKDQLSKLKRFRLKDIQEGLPPYGRLSYKLRPGDDYSAFRFICLPAGTTPVGSQP